MIGARASAAFRPSFLLGLPYPLRNVLRRWRGLLGMMLGAGLALGIGMTLLAVSRASLELFTGDYRLSSAGLYVVTNGGNVIPLLPGESAGTIRQAGHLLGQIRGLPTVEGVLGVMNWQMERQRPGPRRTDQPAELFTVMGVDGDPADVPGSLLLKQGRWLRRADEVVLGGKISRDTGLRPGDTLRLNERDFTVVGIGRLRGFGLSTDSLVYLDYRVLSQRAEVGDVISIIAVSAGRPEQVRERIRELGGYSVFTPADLIRQAETVNAAGVALRWVFNVLTLAIAGLFVSNMLARSVVERRLEFATLRAIGLPSRTILLTVAAEAVLVCAVAALIGVLVSGALGVLLNQYLAPRYGFESLYAADATLFGVVFTLALALGVGAGVLPARAATRVDPVEVLREG